MKVGETPGRLVDAYLHAIDVYEKALLPSNGWEIAGPYVAAVATLFVGGAAVFVAWRQLGANAKAAKLQNTLSFIVNSETEPMVASGYAVYTEVFSRRPRELTPNDVIKKNSLYIPLLTILNLYEYCAIGLKRGALDEEILKDYWSDLYVSQFCKMYPLVMAIELTNSGRQKVALEEDGSGQSTKNIEVTKVQMGTLYNHSRDRAITWIDEIIEDLNKKMAKEQDADLKKEIKKDKNIYENYKNVLCKAHRWEQLSGRNFKEIYTELNI